MDFGSKLKKWLILKFGSVTNGAMAFGMRQGDMSKYTTGTREPGFGFFVKAVAHKAPLTWLLDEDSGDEIRQDTQDDVVRFLEKRLNAFVKENDDLKDEIKKLRAKIGNLEQELKEARPALKIIKQIEAMKKE